ncbi:MAG: Ig-like domain-containing protein, partial [Bacteroidales bacterium]|nr:Ig-like domain-containing protein [Bacteroidales bacterium]
MASLATNLGSHSQYATLSNTTGGGQLSNNQVVVKQASPLVKSFKNKNPHSEQYSSQCNGNSCAVAPVVSRRATTTTTLSTFSSAKPTFSSAKPIVNYPLSILLIVFCLLFGANAWGQTTIKMGADGSANTLPFNNWYKNSWNQMIYTAEELGGSQNITSISFLIGGVPSDNWSATGLKIYLGHTTLCGTTGTSDLTTTSWVPLSSLTQVYSSTSYTPTTYTTYTDFAQNWWVTITLSSSFSYNGTDNLAIVIAQQCSTYQSGLTFKYITDAHNQCLYRRNDTDATYYTSHPGTNTGNLSTYRPILKLNGAEKIINIKKNSLAMGQEYYFVDEGGDGGDCSNGDATYNYYTRSAQFRHVFTAPSGAIIKATFLTLCTESTSYDYMHIYDGSNTSATVLASTLGGSPSDMPGPYSSTGQYMTFMFRTDGSVNRAGFKATLSCLANCTSRTLSFASGANQVAVGSTISRPATPSAGSGTVTYSSSNTSVAQVDGSGVITGVGVGSATITATISANGDYCSATNTYSVSVIAPTPIITQTTPLPQCGIADAVLTASLAGGVSVPSGYTYHWYSNSACTTEITSGVSGTNNNTLTYPIAANTIVYCRLERRVAGTTTQAQTFDYTGDVQTYTVPAGATSLLLEVWGAQGGTYSYSGGNGGYSKGTLNSPTAGSTLYVVVGGQPIAITSTPTATSTTVYNGGYNGGGNVVVHYWSDNYTLAQPGGGATHIATRSGVLSSLSSYQSDVLIVAGGGSGSVYYYNGSNYGGFAGYAGGGSTSSAYSATYQATQSAAGNGGSFGQGASNTNGYNYKYGPAGGGGGWWGGGCNSGYSDTYSEELVRGHGGGSGYIKSTLTSPSSTNASRSGHGQAKITATIPTIEIANSSSAVSYSVECTNCDDPAGTYAISGSATQSLGTEQNLTLTVNNTTGYTIAWESANSSIVTVSGSGNSATITGVSLGSTTVTATITPSDVSICPKTLTYTITVNPTITFDISTNCSGTASGQPEPQTVTVGTNVTVPWGGITCSDGKTFVGWNASADGTGLAYREGDVVQVTQNITLYAIFMPDPCDNIVDMQVGVDYEGILGDMGLWDTHNDDCGWDEPGEERVYSFTPYKTGTHIFTFGTIDGDPDFYISTSCSNTVATLYCADEEDEYEMELTRGTTYYVIVDNAEDEISAEYLVRVAVLDPSGGVNSPCGTTIIYCSLSGNDGNDGGSTSPVKTLSQALTLANSVSPTADNPAIIRMASGTYDVNAPVNLISNVIIDGQWTANTTTGVWTKGTALTTIHRTATSPEGGTTMPRITAIEGNNKSNFKLQDIKVTTVNAPVYSAITSNNYGVSTYAVHLNGCSGYEFVRCRLQPGNASAGKNGTNGSTGASGGSGSNGSSGSSNTAYSGGAGGTNSSCSSANGYSGGAGGRDDSRGSQGGGSGGAGGNVESSGSTGSAGSNGSAGTSYSGQRASVNNTSTYYGEYFKGTQARTGGNGGYGTGGRGGGGGGGTDATASWCERGGGGGSGGG